MACFQVDRQKATLAPVASCFSATACRAVRSAKARFDLLAHGHPNGRFRRIASVRCRLSQPVEASWRWGGRGRLR